MIRTSDTANRGHDFSFNQPLGVLYPQILRSVIRVVHEFVLRWRAPLKIFSKVSKKTYIYRAIGLPANNLTG